jgi:tRNA-specific 2-thiouridylase
MRNWDTRDEYASDKGCEWEKDWQEVQVVCRKLGIPCELVRCDDHIFTYFFERFHHRLIFLANTGTVSLSHPCDSGNLASAQTLMFGVTSKVFILVIFYEEIDANYREIKFGALLERLPQGTKLEQNSWFATGTIQYFILLYFPF